MAKSIGRRRKGEGPAFPHDEVEQALVHGEPVETPEGELKRVRYPTYRELAERYGVAHSLIAQFSKTHNCRQRREQAEKRVREISDAKLAELRADRLAIERDDVIRAIDRFLVQFEEELRNGRVRCDNPSDFNLMVRLKVFLQGDAESRHELRDMPSLEELQRRYKKTLDDWNASTPGTRGEVPQGNTLQ